MTPIQISVTMNILSLLLGFVAWGLGLAAIIRAKTGGSYVTTVLSFSFCAVSLILQLFEVQNRVNIGDFSAIADTIRAVILAAVTLVAVTVALNLVALVKARKK